MKKKIVIIAAIMVLLIAGYFLMSYYSAKLIKPKVIEAFGPGSSISQINVTMSYVALKGIHIEDPQTKLELLNIDEIRVTPVIWTLLSRQDIIISSIVFDNPHIFVYRGRDSVLTGPGISEKKRKTEPGKKTSDKITVKKIKINGGYLRFIDHKNNEPPAIIKLLELQSGVNNIKHPFPVNNKSPLVVKSKISKENDGNISIKGWIDLESMNLELKIDLTEVEMKPFEPYYEKKFGDLIKGGNATIESSVKIHNHILDVTGNLRLFNLDINEKSSFQGVITKEMLSQILKKQDNQVKTDFSVKGDLQNPQFSPGYEISKSILSNLSSKTGISIIEEKGEKYIKEKSKSWIPKPKK